MHCTTNPPIPLGSIGYWKGGESKSNTGPHFLSTYTTPYVSYATLSPQRAQHAREGSVSFLLLLWGGRGGGNKKEKERKGKKIKRKKKKEKRIIKEKIIIKRNS